VPELLCPIPTLKSRPVRSLLVTSGGHLLQRWHLTYDYEMLIHWAAPTAVWVMQVLDWPQPLRLSNQVPHPILANITQYPIPQYWYCLNHTFDSSKDAYRRPLWWRYTGSSEQCYNSVLFSRKVKWNWKICSVMVQWQIAYIFFEIINWHWHGATTQGIAWTFAMILTSLTS